MSHQTLCPIWGSSAELEAGSIGDGTKINSPRAAGRYGISGSAVEVVKSLSNHDKSLLTTWLIEQRQFGVNLPIVNSNVREVISSRRPLRISEKKERLLRYAGMKRWGPGLNIYLNAHSNIDERTTKNTELIAAWVEASSLEEAMGIVGLLIDEGLVRPGHHSSFSITSKGFERIESLESSGPATLQAFVAMWFAKEMKEAWRLAFAPAIRDAGYKPFRIDNLQHNGKIDDAIVAEIKRSRFLVADFTCGGVDSEEGFQPNPRGGVYYEAGLAHGLGMEVIFTCREDRLAWLHFDTRQFAHIVWKTPEDLREQLYNRISATLKDAPNAPGKGGGSVDPA